MPNNPAGNNDLGSLFIYAQNPITKKVEKIATTASLQVGLDYSPAGLFVTGRIGVNSTNISIESGKVYNADDNVTILNVSPVGNSGFVTINLPKSPQKGQIIFVKDYSGNSRNVNIIITCLSSANAIDGSLSKTISSNYGILQFAWQGSSWIVVTSENGTQGVQGPQGPQGIQGTIGQQGLQGVTGPLGGPTGPQGRQGYQGIIGPQGYQGYQGRQGITGPQGYQGYQGRQGITGPQGLQGYQGHQGYQGSTGPLGGPQGLQGSTGPLGPQGKQGSTGPQGYQGLTGPQGLGTSISSYTVNISSFTSDGINPATPTATGNYVSIGNYYIVKIEIQLATNFGSRGLATVSLPVSPTHAITATVLNTGTDAITSATAPAGGHVLTLAATTYDSNKKIVNISYWH
jgi:hypothetical protein